MSNHLFSGSSVNLSVTVNLTVTGSFAVTLNLKFCIMNWPGKETARELQEALGKPKYYIDTEGKKEGEQYFWFPTLGDSMTDKTRESIPSGSLVLGRLLALTDLSHIALDRPIVFIIHDDGQKFCLLKCVSRMETDPEKIWLRSYNPRYEDFWLPFSCIEFAFIVERVRRPDGSEFVPHQTV